MAAGESGCAAAAAAAAANWPAAATFGSLTGPAEAAAAAQASACLQIAVRCSVHAADPPIHTQAPSQDTAYIRGVQTTQEQIMQC